MVILIRTMRKHMRAHKILFGIALFILCIWVYQFKDVYIEDDTKTAQDIVQKFQDHNETRVSNKGYGSSGDTITSKKVWRWVCKDGTCDKTRIDSFDKGPVHNVETCRMLCYQDGLLWPKPTGSIQIGKKITPINMDTITMDLTKSGKADDLVNAAFERFKKNIRSIIPKRVTAKNKGNTLHIHLEIKDPDFRNITIAMNEHYNLSVSPDSGKEVAHISSDTFFGMRHGLETLSQLIIYDEIYNRVTIVSNTSIIDSPVYSYRGVLLDTSRNYHSVDAIKKTIDAMATVKLNTFHWHITDMQSFPFASEKRPELTKYGAYSPEKIYTKKSIRDIVKYATVRGVRVLPEFDTPAHVGEGWQFSNLTLCFKAKPWNAYAKSPPGGQLDPTIDELYDVLEDIYTEFAEVFPTDMFHMGVDEVTENCWMSSKNVQDFIKNKGWETNKFTQLMDYYLRKAESRVFKAFGKIPIIVWSSSMTEPDEIQKHFNKTDYIIQVYEEPKTGYKGLLKEGYKIIMSDYHNLFLDCGYGSWVKDGVNWCSPYNEWQKVYSYNFTDLRAEFKDQILGGEVSLWTETSDEMSLDNKMWPRAAALAERLWSDPKTTWNAAQYRLYHIRNHLTKLGVMADSVQNEWCYQNEGYCVI